MKQTTLTIIFVVSAIMLAAQTLTIDAPDSLRMGEPFTVTAELTAPNDAQVTAPKPGPLGAFELTDITTRQRGETFTANLTLVPFEIGDVTIPEMAFQVGDETIYTEPVSIEVRSSLSSTSTLADIAGPTPVRPRVWDFLIPLVVLAAAAYVIWRYRRKPMEEADTAAAPVDNRTAWQVALEMLAELRADGSLERDDMLAWYFGLSMVTRTFLERFTGVNAVEMTTSEIVSALPDVPHRQRVIDFLRKADGVKFATQQPPAGEASSAADWLEQYLHSFEHRETKKEADHV